MSVVPRAMRCCGLFYGCAKSPVTFGHIRSRNSWSFLDYWQFPFWSFPSLPDSDPARSVAVKFASLRGTKNRKSAIIRYKPTANTLYLIFACSPGVSICSLFV